MSEGGGGVQDIGKFGSVQNRWIEPVSFIYIGAAVGILRSSFNVFCFFINIPEIIILRIRDLNALYGIYRYTAIWQLRFIFFYFRVTFVRKN